MHHLLKSFSTNILVTKTAALNLFRQILKNKAVESWLRNKIIENPGSLLYCKLAPSNYQYVKGSIREFKIQNDVVLEVDISDYVGHYLYFGFKDIGHDRLFELVNKGDHILDIGTNIGSTILRFASLIGNEGFVYGFEPDPTNYANCLRNLMLNNFSNIEVSNIGIGDQQGSFNLVIYSGSNMGMNRISERISEQVSTRIQVERLDDWIFNKSINKVDLVKIDVEGYELKVLKGGEKSILHFKPILFIELDDNYLRATGGCAKDLIELLEEWNYAIVNSVTGLSIKSSDNLSNCHFDIIAKKK